MATPVTGAVRASRRTASEGGAAAGDCRNGGELARRLSCAALMSRELCGVGTAMLISGAVVVPIHGQRDGHTDHAAWGHDGNGTAIRISMRIACDDEVAGSDHQLNNAGCVGEGLRPVIIREGTGYCGSPAEACRNIL